MSVKDSPIAGSVGVVDADGVGVIPFNVVGGEVGLTAYDPVSGLFDGSAGHVSIGDPLSESHVVGVSFAPDRSTKKVPLAIGESANGLIVPGRARCEFAVYVPAGLVGLPLSFGLRAVNALTLWIQSPKGEFAFRDSSTRCALLKGFVPLEAGTYVLSVGFGVTGGAGAFTVGASKSPAPPTPYLCGSVRDTLYAVYSPYICADAATVASGEALSVEPGVVIEFEQGGILLGSGAVRGNANSMAPIVLRGSPSTVAGNTILHMASRTRFASSPGHKAASR